MKKLSLHKKSDTQRWGDWTESATGAWFLLPFSSGSDYSGSLVEVSNAQVWAETFPKGEGKWWKHVRGWHGTFGIVVRTLALKASEVRVFVGDLEDYPLADEDHHSHLEYTTMCAAWESDGRVDFLAEVRAYVAFGLGCDKGDDAIAVAVDAVGKKQWDCTWIDICDRSNVNGGCGYANENGTEIFFYANEAVWGREAGRYPNRDVGNFGFWDFMLEDGRDFRELVRAVPGFQLSLDVKGGV